MGLGQGVLGMMHQACLGRIAGFWHKPGRSWGVCQGLLGGTVGAGVGTGHDMPYQGYLGRMAGWSWSRHGPRAFWGPPL